MSNEEINYWLETFEETRHGFMSKDGKTLSFYDTFKTMKDLQNNWNELKKYISEQINYYSLDDEDYKEFNVLDSVEQYMQELEQGKEK